MGRKALDLAGKNFGKLKVISRCPGPNKNNSYWKCICFCSEEKIVSGINLKSGNSKTCGCSQTSINGLSKTKEFGVWLSIIQRCENKNHKKYHRYGGRGINVCQKWRDSFLNFIEDMGKCSPKKSIERLNNDGNYSPENCKWAPIEKQNNNRGEYNIFIERDGITKTASQWAHQYNIRPSTFIARIKRYGWGVEKALTTPVSRYR